MNFILMVVIFFLYRIMSLKSDLRVLQLNHYQISRTITYVQHSFQLTKLRVCKLLIHIPFFCLLFVKNNTLDILVLMLFVYIYITYKFKETLKNEVHLKYTNRIKRLYLILFVLYFCLILCFYNASLFIIGILFLMSSNKIIILLASIIAYPIEWGIQKYYIEDAKGILKQNKDIIKVGIVGSYGKTSTKNILYLLLSTKYYCLKSKGSYNNMMGNTLTIRKELKRVHELFLCEMGSDHLYEIKKLMHFIEPQYVVITSIGDQHIKTFKTQENIIQEKTSPLLYLRKVDVAFLNLDNKYIYANKDKGECRKITFGKNLESDYCVQEINVYEWGSSFKIFHKEEEVELKTTLLGYYNIMNIVGSVAVAHFLGVSFKEIQKYVENLKPIEHRLQSIKKNHYTLIDNAYNSNSLSFNNSLSILKKIEKYTIFVTPGVIDFQDNEKMNEQLMSEIDEQIDEVIIVGYQNRRALLQGLKNKKYLNYKIMDTMEEALAYVDALERDSFVVLIENDIDKDFMNLQS